MSKYHSQFSREFHDTCKIDGDLLESQRNALQIVADREPYHKAEIEGVINLLDSILDDLAVKENQT